MTETSPVPNKPPSPVENFCLLKIKPEALQAHGLPVCPYPVPLPAMTAVLETESMQPAQLLVWMQEYVQYAETPWREYLAPMRQLMELLAPEDSDPSIRVEGHNWALFCGPVDLCRPMIAFCRQGELLAAAQKHESGCLQVCCYQPLDAHTCRTVLAGSLKPAADGTVVMRPNNWEYLADNACMSGQTYSFTNGTSYMALWKFGFGITGERKVHPEWYPKRNVTPFSAAVLASLLRSYCELTTDDLP